MSLRSQSRSSRVPKKSKVESIEERELATISIKLSDFENLKYLKNDFKNLRIVGNFLGNEIEKKSDGENFLDCFKCLDEDVNLKFEFSVNVNEEEEIFDLFTNPIQFNLLDCDSSSTLGISSIDLISLCNDNPEHRSLRLKFHPVNIGKQFPMFRTISCIAEISSNQAILKNSLGNSLLVTIDSIFNLGVKTDSPITIGFMAPINEKFTKSFVFSHPCDPCQVTFQHESKGKRWLTLSHISGKAAESSYAEQPYDFPMGELEKVLMSKIRNQTIIKSMGRVILSNETNDFLKRHIENSSKLAVEVMHDNDHFTGFVDLQALLCDNRKRVRSVVPLKKFNQSEFQQQCHYESVFFKPKKISKREGKKSSRSTAAIIPQIPEESIEQITEPIFLNEDCLEVFMILEFEVEKAFNEKAPEELSEQMSPETSQEPIDIIIEEKIDECVKKLQVMTKNIFKIYGHECSINEIEEKMIKDGYFEAFEDQMLPYLCDLKSYEANQSFEDFHADVLCRLSSTAFNKNCLEEKPKQDEHLKAQLYDWLQMDKKADEIFLSQIYENRNEKCWIDYAIHQLRRENFNKALACIDEAKTLNITSLLGHVLQVYIFFKLQNYPQCDRLINLIEQNHGSSDEISMIRRLVQKASKIHESDFSNKSTDFPDFQQVYESKELLWSATIHDEEFLNWNDKFIKLTVFFIKLGFFDFAEITIDKYYATNGENLNCPYLLAVIDAIKGNYSDALIHLNKITKKQIDKIEMFKSLLLMKIGKHQKALELFSSSVSLSEINLEKFLVTFTSGKYLKEIGEYYKAYKPLKLAFDTLPCDLTAVELGKCLMKLNQLSSSEKCFQEAITLDPSSLEPWNHLNGIYTKQNRVRLTELCMKNFNCV